MAIGHLVHLDVHGDGIGIQVGLVTARADRRAPERAVEEIRAAPRGPRRRLAGGAAEAASSCGDAARGAPSSSPRGALEQVLDNLIANAIDAAPPAPGGRSPRPRGTGQPRSPSTDAGPGMAAEQREHAFDRFCAATTTGAAPASGLAIVKRLVEADGGRSASRRPRRRAPGDGGLPARGRLPRD